VTELVECLEAFAGGSSEAVCIFWFAASERGLVWRAGALSMVYALILERGMGAAIHTIAGETCFVLGFGFWTVAAVRLKTWLRARGILT